MSNEPKIRIVRALRYHGDTSWNYKNVVYPSNVLYFVLAGDGHIQVNQQVTHLVPGNAYLIPAGLPHNLWCDTSIRKMYMNVHLEQIPGLDLFDHVKEVLQAPIGLERCQQMYDACGGGTREQLFILSQTALLMSQLLPRDLPPLSARMVALAPLMEEVRLHLSARIRREDIARRFGWHPSALSRAFKEAFGCRLKEYVEKLLADRLAEELILTDKSIQQLAEEYAFCDSYYLSHFFKRMTGMSPSAYRRASQPSG